MLPPGYVRAIDSDPLLAARARTRAACLRQDPSWSGHRNLVAT